MPVGIRKIFLWPNNAMLGIWRKWRKPMTETLESVLASLPVQQQEAIAQQTKQLVAEEMTLRELRKARVRSQELMGRTLNVNQTAVSKIERRADMYVSTLRAFIEAMGGELEIIARFPDHPPVKITQFQELADKP